jgi:hypothetical protein
MVRRKGIHATGGRLGTITDNSAVDGGLDLVRERQHDGDASRSANRLGRQRWGIGDRA